jgi:hypothetical protein
MIVRWLAVTFFFLILGVFLSTFPQLSQASVSTAYVFPTNLQLHDTGSEVLLLQTFLDAQGYLIAPSGPGSPGNETTFFGLRTYSALVRYQRAHDLPATGFFGLLTRGEIASGASAITPPDSTTVNSQSVVPLHLPLPSASLSYGGGGEGGGGAHAPVAPAPTVPATPTLSVTNSPVTYNGSAQAATVTGSVSGTVSSVKYNGSATVATAAGTYAITANFAPTDSTDYSSLTAASAGNFVINNNTTPPTVSLTAPTNGATVSGSSVTLTASSSDSVGVAAVQFKIDGTNVGASGTTTPYSITWNSTSVADGSHTIAAVAEDTSGLYATSTIGATVRNNPPVISAIATSSATSTGETIMWTTDEAATSQINYGTTTSYGSASSSAALVTSHSITLAGLASEITYRFQVQSADSQGNTATSSDQTFSPGTPLPLPGNLVADFSANAITGVANNAQIGSWTDSINGIVAAQATSTNQPVFTANRLNSLPSVKFGGSAWLTIATPGVLKTAIDSTGYTVFIVFRTLGSKSDGALLSATTGGSAFFYIADGANLTDFNDDGVDLSVPDSASTFTTFGSTCFSSTTPTYSSTGTFETMYVNGGAVTSNALACPGTGGHTITIGDNAGNNFPVNAEIFEILVWNTPLTPVQYKQAQMWADNKYGQSYPWAGINDYNVFFGDSIMQGVGATAVADQAPYLIAQSLGLSYGQWDNLGIGGITTAHLSTLAPTWIDPLPALIGKKVNLSSFEWYNDSGSGTLGASGPFSDAQAYLAARKAVANIRTVWGTSTGYSGDPSANRNAYDADFDAASTTNIDAYVALHNDPEIGTSTAYATYPGNWSDVVHLSNTGYTYLASDFLTAIESLPQ